MVQTSLRQCVEFEGIGVHSGEACKVTISSADANSGIVFVHKPSGSVIPARFSNVISADMCTCLSVDGVNKIYTIEHILSALYGVGICNAVIEVDGNEIPIMDGSADPFVLAILKVGITNQNAARRNLKIKREVSVKENNKYVSLVPSDCFRLEIECDFSAKGLNTKPMKIDCCYDTYCTEIASARTFGFIEDAELIKKHGLALGASLDNTVVFDRDGKPMNPDGLRLDNEPVRHKILDAIGDLSLAECYISGKYNAFCPSHKLNNMLLRELFSDEKNYEIV